MNCVHASEKWELPLPFLKSLQGKMVQPAETDLSQEPRAIQHCVSEGNWIFRSEKLPELMENTLRHRLGFLGSPVQA